MQPVQQPVMCPVQLQTYDWSYNPDLSTDQNFLDLALTISRNSKCEGGHMGCVIVGPEPNPTQPLMLAVNSTLYEPESNRSDVHAEQNAICAAARMGLKLDGCSAYITMPPCKTCFALLQAAGVRKCVFRRKQFYDDMTQAAERLGIAMVEHCDNQVCDESLERVKELWDRYMAAHPDYAAQELAESKASTLRAREFRKRKKQEQREQGENGNKKQRGAGKASAGQRDEQAGEAGAQDSGHTGNDVGTGEGDAKQQ